MNEVVPQFPSCLHSQDEEAVECNDMMMTLAANISWEPPTLRYYAKCQSFSYVEGMDPFNPHKAPKVR